MAAALSDRPRLRVEVFGMDPRERKRRFGVGDRLVESRLSPADANLLQWVFDELEGSMGISSNFGAMCLKIQEGQTFERTHSEDIVERMHVRSRSDATGTRRDAPVERWACWSNHGHDGGRERLGSAIIHARAAVRTIDLAHAVTLFRMYGQDTPKPRYQRFPDLLELVPLVEDCRIVHAHAERLTAAARRAHHAESRRSVTAREAMSDLLEPKDGETKSARARRKALCLEVYRQCAQMLVCASEAYREAFVAVGRGVRETWPTRVGACCQCGEIGCLEAIALSEGD